MNAIYYIGLDIHKKVIAYCIKRIDGTLVRQGTVTSERKALLKWLAELPGPWFGAMEATILPAGENSGDAIPNSHTPHPEFIDAMNSFEEDPQTEPLSLFTHDTQTKGHTSQLIAVRYGLESTEYVTSLHTLTSPDN